MIYIFTYQLPPRDVWAGITSDITPQSDCRTLLYWKGSTWLYALYCCWGCNI